MPVTIVLIALGGFVSLLLPCVTPFGALAACAALRGRSRYALLVIAATWLVNEAAGFGFFGYPRTGESLAWALLSLVAAAVATVVCAAVVFALRKRPYALRAAAAAATATLVFEGALYLAARIAGMSLAGFALPIDVLVIETNALFFLAFEAIAYTLGALLARRSTQR
jgi:hypothetical protein